MPDEATEHVRAQWLLRVEAEYHSAALTQELTLWMTQAGVSPDLLHDGLRIADDELMHAALSMDVYLAAGGTRRPTLSRSSLAIPRRAGDPLEHDIVRVGVDGFCLGETVAVPLFRRLREGCSVPVARKALDRILRDEVRHRDFGWELLSWMLDTPLGADLRALVARELPAWFARIRRSYAPAFAERLDTVHDLDRAWGLMAPARYRAVVDRTWERDWKPRFTALDIDASPAWELAARATG